MNRLVAAQLISTAREGKRVMVLAGNHQRARHAFDEVAYLATDALRIRRANGDRRIDYYGGGSIDFRPVQGTGYRGYSANLVYVDDAEADEFLSHGLYADVHALVATTGGEIIRA